jgi:hypothetical protein
MTDETPTYRIETPHKARPPTPYVGQIYRNDEPVPLWTSKGGFASTRAAYAAADRKREQLENSDLKARAAKAKGSKRPQDRNQLAKTIVDLATKDDD